MRKQLSPKGGLSTVYCGMGVILRTGEKMIKIIDYKAGNVLSVMHAVNKLGHKADFAQD